VVAGFGAPGAVDHKTSLVYIAAAMFLAGVWLRSRCRQRPRRRPAAGADAERHAAIRQSHNPLDRCS
jgi:hypothetical protein